jgi:putative YphP/YqiW family bacilliredoxin
MILKQLTTTFAGVDRDAVEHARKYMLPYLPSSPSIALFKDGKLLHMIECHHIEGRTANMIADNLKMAFEEYCQSQISQRTSPGNFWGFLFICISSI